MDTRYDEHIFLSYIEGDLSPDEKAQFEDVLDQDPDLRKLVAHIRADRARLRDLPAEDPPHELAERINLQLERDMLLDAPPPDLNPVSPAGRFRIGRTIAYASLAAMILMSTALVVNTLVDRKLYDYFTPTSQSPFTNASTSPDDRFARQSQPQPSTLALSTESHAADQLLPQEPADQPPLTGFASAEQKSPDPQLRSANALRENDIDNDIFRALAGRKRSAAKPPPPLKERFEESKKLAKTNAPAIDTFARLTPADTSADVPAEALAEVPAPTKSVAPGKAQGPLAQRVLRRLQNAKDAAAQPAEQTPALAQADRRDTEADTKSDTQAAATPSTPTKLVVHVTTPDADATQQQLLAWALGNSVHIASLTTLERRQTQTKAETSQHPTTKKQLTPPPAKQIALTVTGQQLFQLLSHLRRQPDHHADIVTSHAQSTGNSTATPDSNANTPSLLGQTRQLPQPPPTVRSISELDWDHLLSLYLPLQPITPFYEPDAQIELTLQLLEKHDQ